MISFWYRVIALVHRDISAWPTVWTPKSGEIPGSVAEVCEDGVCNYLESRSISKANRACTNEPFDMLMWFWIVAEAERRVMRMYQAGLVLEGGGMKGVYTAGVLDFLRKGN